MFPGSGVCVVVFGSKGRNVFVCGVCGNMLGRRGREARWCTNCGERDSVGSAGLTAVIAWQ